MIAAVEKVKLQAVKVKNSFEVLSISEEEDEEEFPELNSVEEDPPGLTDRSGDEEKDKVKKDKVLYLIHISEPKRPY